MQFGLGGGTSNVGFDYRIMARRQGYESIRLADTTEQFQALSTSMSRKNVPLENPVRIGPYRAADETLGHPAGIKNENSRRNPIPR